MAINIFEPYQLKSINFNNRIIRSATDEGLADSEGDPSQDLLKMYKKLANGHVGAIITGFISVSKDGKSVMPGMMMIDSDDRIAGHASMVEEIHKENCSIIAQLAHCGRSGVGGKKCQIERLSLEHIKDIEKDFINAAIRAYKAGYDAIELHLAHGYLLSEFLSPHTNKRKDMYGGSLEARLKLILDIIFGIREQIPAYPILVKINGSEDYPDGIDSELASQNALALEKAGVDAIEVSCGIDWNSMGPSRGKIPVDMLLAHYPQLKTKPKFIKKLIRPNLAGLMKEVEATSSYNLASAVRIKEAVKIPLILVGGLHSLEDFESAINEHGMDMVAASRPFIIEPNFVEKLESGVASKSRCIECNNCLAGLYDRSLRCYYGKVF